MPDDRPPPVRLNPPPRPKSSKSKPSKRRRKARAAKDDFALLYWIAGGLIVLLLVLITLYAETPQIKGWFANRETPLKKLTHAPAKPPVSPQPNHEEKPPAVKHPAPKPIPPPVATIPSPARETQPPLVQPVPIDIVPGAPARALPLDPNKLDTERIAAYQVALERIHFSCGFIDGDQGMRTQRMLRAYQASRDLPITGFLDQATRGAIGEPGEPFLSYVVTADDVASIMPKPTTWWAKSKVSRLGYNDIWEMLAEKFHCTRSYLKDLNRGVTTPTTGTEVIGPKVYPAAPIPKAASLRILLSETSLEALDSGGRVIAFFPCSIAKDKNKRPHGFLTVKVVDPNPDYTFDPALFADAAKAEGITHKMVLPPGPRNPVGTTWVGLSLPGYGIHGTPDPEAISRTQSHGCFRLANWNAEKVLKMVRVGTPVDVEP
jgi:lipoprotein-anchoring transpeptidase ErfK/SrfK